MNELPKLLPLLLTLSFILCHVSGEIPRQELESATAALRSKGYNLFGNSLTVSDLLFQVLSGEEFTFLSPTDTSLFSLGMSIDSFRYVHSLRLHVIPRRLSISDLRNLTLSPTPSIATLVPTHSLFLANRRRDFTSSNSGSSASVDFVVVNGVRISSPDIFLGSHIAVHGLDGTLAADLLPPETFQGDLGLGSFVSPPAWPPSERSAPLPSTVPDQDSVPGPVSPLIENFSPDLNGNPIFQYPDLPPSPPPQIARVPSPESEVFANSPESPRIVPGSFAPVSPAPSIGMVPQIPSPWNDQRNSGGAGQVESSFVPMNPSPESSPSVKTPPPSQAPYAFSPPRIWRTPPPTYQKVWRNEPRSHPWRKPKESREHTKHRKSKKKHKCHSHHRKHKGQ